MLDRLPICTYGIMFNMDKYVTSKPIYLFIQILKALFLSHTHTQQII